MLAFTHMWTRGYKLIDISQELGIGYTACVDWSSYCREICLNAFIQHPRQLGGPGKTVEIDESKFGNTSFIGVTMSRDVGCLAELNAKAGRCLWRS